MVLDRLTSAVYNDIYAALSGMNANPNISLEQLQDEIIEKRESIIKEWYLKGLLKPHDLMQTISCISVDCADPSKCCNTSSGKRVSHFEIPPLANDLGAAAIDWIGSTDKEVRFDVYYTSDALKYRKYKKRGADKPYVFVDRTLNKNGMYDCWLYNAPFVKMLTVSAIFKDPRQLEKYSCCVPSDFLDLGSVSNEIKTRLTEQKIRYYRGRNAITMPNTQIPE